MRVTEVIYAEVKNLGNYENRRLEVTVALAEDEDTPEHAKEALQRARAFVHRNIQKTPESSILSDESRLRALQEEEKLNEASSF